MTDIVDLALMICGIALFLFALGLITFLVRKGRSFVGAAALLPVAIVMIGFSHLRDVTIGKEGIHFDEQSTTALMQDPRDPVRIANYRASLTTLEKARASNPDAPLPAAVKASLANTVSTLRSHSDLPPEARVAQAHAELLLGQRTEAVATLRAALKAKPSLNQSIHPTLRALLNSPTS